MTKKRQERPEYEELASPKKELMVRACRSKLIGIITQACNTGRAILSCIKEFDSAFDDYSEAFFDDYLYPPMIKRKLEFTEGLRQLKQKEIMPQEPKVLYAGCGRDTSVQRVFPNTVNLDLKKPRPMPKNFNFVQGNIIAMPFDSSSFDLVVSHGLCLDSASIPELARVLRSTGVIIADQYTTTESEQIPNLDHRDYLYYLQHNICRLRNLCHLHEYSFDRTGQLSNGSEVIEKGKVTPERELQVRQELAEARKLLSEKRAVTTDA